ncbi:MAG: DUF4388 domain-containing protein [bacterium]
MSIEGNLKEFGLADIFQLIYMQQKDGLLQITLEGRSADVIFKRGLVVFTFLGERENEKRLGQVLLRLGIITDKDVDDSLHEQNKVKLKLGKILVSKGIISQEDLAQAIKLQVEETIYELFKWPNGHFKFHSRIDTDYDYEINHLIPLNTQNLIMEGIRQLDEWPIIEKSIYSTNMICTKIKGAKERIFSKEEISDENKEVLSLEHLDEMVSGQKIALTQSEKYIFNLVSIYRTIGDIIDLSKVNKFETLKILYGFLKAGLIEQVTEKHVEVKNTLLFDLITEKVTSGVSQAFTATFTLFTVIAIIACCFISFSILQSTSRNYLKGVAYFIEESALLTLQNTLELYKLNYRRYPDDLELLVKEGLISPRIKQIFDKKYKYIYVKESDSYELKNFNVEVGR